METKNEILSSVTRYIDRYGWSWNLARRLVNRRFGTDYTEKELKRLYREANEGHIRHFHLPPSM